MLNLLWSALLAVLLLSGCGWNGTPTRSPEGLVPPSSIEIVPESIATAASGTIGTGTSTKLKAYGFYSGVRLDITNQTSLVWKSDSPAIADFISTTPNRVSGVSAGTAAITAEVGGVKGTYTLTVSNAPLVSVAVEPAAPPALPKGRSMQFTATGDFTSFKQDLTYDAAWTSSDTAVVTISKDAAGNVFAKAVASAGSSTITASIGAPAVSGSTTLAVTNPVLDSIAVTPSNSSVAGINKTVNFTATGTYSDGTTAVITSTVTWSSSQTGVATINSSTGEATTVAAGTTTITASTGSISGSTTLTVTNLVLKTNGLQITPATKTLSITATQQMTVIATYTDNSTQDVTSSCSWTSTVPTVATVTVTTGLVTGVAAGSTAITASYGGQSVTAIIIVQ